MPQMMLYYAELVPAAGPSVVLTKIANRGDLHVASSGRRPAVCSNFFFDSAISNRLLNSIFIFKLYSIYSSIMHISIYIDICIVRGR